MGEGREVWVRVDDVFLGDSEGVEFGFDILIVYRKHLN